MHLEFLLQIQEMFDLFIYQIDALLTQPNVMSLEAMQQQEYDPIDQVLRFKSNSIRAIYCN